MSFQGLSWKECAAITCPVCLKFFNETDQRPIALGCGHTVCKCCVKQEFKNNCCPFDQYALQGDVDSMPANYALMPLVERAMLAEAAEERASRGTRSEVDSARCYEQAVNHVEEMARHLEPLVVEQDDSDDWSVEEDDASTSGSRPRRPTASQPPRCMLSQQMQRKVISLIHCQLLEEEGRARAARVAHAMASRAVLEMLAALASPSQLSTSLWAAVRTRGCQFLGPAMQEEVLNLIVLALEDGNFLSRKVLVLFVVQRLAAQYPQASKTAIGHVVQLLYRASCFKVVKKEEESSVMQLKSEFRCYDTLRREHDAQIVTIAAEAGLRISPEQWSSLLYGDSGHKSHMQSIIDKHQSPHTFTQSVVELMATLQRTGDPASLSQLQPQLEFLSNIDPNPDCPAPSWENVEAIMRSLNTVLTSLVHFLSLPSSQKTSESPQQSGRFKTSMCRDFLSRGSCPRGANCTFAHSHLELDRYRSRSRRGVHKPASSTSPTCGETDHQSDHQLQLMSRMTLDDPITTSTNTSVQELTPREAPPGGGTKDIDTGGPPFLAQVAPTTPGATHLTFTQGAARAPDCMRAPAASHQTYYHPHNRGPPPDVTRGTGDYGGPYLTHCYPGTVLPTLPRPAPIHPNLPMPPPRQCVHSPSGSHCFQCPPPLSTAPPPRHCVHGPPPPLGLSPKNDAGAGCPHCTALPQCTIPGSWDKTSSNPAMTTQSVPVTTAEGMLQPCTVQDDSTSTRRSQEQTLASLQCRKQELISHLHDSPVFMGSGAGVYRADSQRAGFAGLKTVLGNNKRTRSAMPKLVSDMFVATRSTQSLDEMLNDDISFSVLPSWSTGEDSANTGKQTETEAIFNPALSNTVLSNTVLSNTVLSNTKLYNPASFNLPSSNSAFSTADIPLFNSAPIKNIMPNPILSEYPFTDRFRHGSMVGPPVDSTMSYDRMLASLRLYNSLHLLPSTEDIQDTQDGLFSQDTDLMDDNILFPSDFEFSCFPSDDGDDYFIPLPHASVSKFGPISRMPKAKTDNAAPVQVTADSCRRITPCLAVTPMERPLSVVSVGSGQSGQTRHCPPGHGLPGGPEVGEPSVNPTPNEKPSVWQHTPCPSYQNIALLRAGAAEAVTNNERLAYELQAVELEISMKTGQTPESVGEMIHSGVMSSPSVATDCQPWSCPGFAPLGEGGQGEMGRGHVTECLTIHSSTKTLVSKPKAAQSMMEEYFRLCGGQHGLTTPQARGQSGIQSPHVGTSQALSSYLWSVGSQPSTQVTSMAREPRVSQSQMGWTSNKIVRDEMSAWADNKIVCGEISGWTGQMK